MIVVHVTSVHFTAENEKVDCEILLTSVLHVKSPTPHFQHFLISKVIIHHFNMINNSDTTKITTEYNRVNVKNI